MQALSDKINHGLSEKNKILSHVTFVGSLLNMRHDLKINLYLFATTDKNTRFLKAAALLMCSRGLLFRLYNKTFYPPAAGTARF